MQLAVQKAVPASHRAQGTHGFCLGPMARRSTGACLSRPGQQAVHASIREPSDLKCTAKQLASIALAACVALQTNLPFSPAPALAKEGVPSHSHQGHMHQQHLELATLAEMMEPPPLPTTSQSPEERALAFGDLGGYTHKAATSSPLAQKLIDQGLLLEMGFNQFEARRSFEAALSADPQAPLAYWGLAYAQGPYLNKAAAPFNPNYPVFTPEELATGRQAIEAGLKAADQQLAAAKKAGREGKERVQLLLKDKAYLLALAPVFKIREPYGKQWEDANRAYAVSMEAWAGAHPEDADAWALAAEAWSNFQAWNFWDLGTSPPQAQGYTQHIQDLLQRSLVVDPNHPLAAHLLIHVTEGFEPARAGTAAAAADLLAKYSTMGHLVHMPSHTYLRVGRWHDGVKVNQAAVALDLDHLKNGIVPEYPCHDAMMGVWIAMEGAERKAALDLASQLASFPDLFGPAYMSEGRDYIARPMVHLRFADWGDLERLSVGQVDESPLGLMLPGGSVDASKALALYINVMTAAAHAQAQLEGAAGEPGISALADGAVLTPSSSTGTTAGSWHTRAQRAYDALTSVVDAMPEDVVTRPGAGLGLYSLAYKAQATQAQTVAAARLAVLDGSWAQATQLMQQAVALESGLGYTEPPRFYQPQAECLGWVLLQQGRLAEAAQAYSQVLAEYPRSPWALTGLQQVYAALDKQQQGQAEGQQPGVVTALAEGVLSREDVKTLLDQVYKESEGQAVRLPSSCPMFSETADIQPSA